MTCACRRYVLCIGPMRQCRRPWQQRAAIPGPQRRDCGRWLSPGGGQHSARGARSVSAGEIQPTQTLSWRYQSRGDTLPAYDPRALLLCFASVRWLGCSLTLPESPCRSVHCTPGATQVSTAGRLLIEGNTALTIRLVFVFHPSSQSFLHRLSLSLSSLPPICAPLSLSLPPLLLSTYPPLSTLLLLLLPPRRSERHAAAPHQQHVRRRADHHRRLSPTEHGRTRVAGKCRRPRRGQRAGAGPLHLPRAAGVQVLLAPAARGPALRCALVCARRTFAKGTSISSRSTENGPAFP